MRKIYLLLLTICLFLISSVSNAKVSVTATAGTTGPTSYTNLSSAFTAINAGTHQGAITIDISASFTDVAPAVLNSSGVGSTSYTSVLLRPSADNVAMSFATASGRGNIELNGADNVTIDGDNPNSAGINRNLTIINTAANTVTFTSVVRLATSTLVTSCDNITIKNCNLTGSGTGRNISTVTSETTTWGVVLSGGASTTDATAAPAALASATTVVPAGQTATNLSVANNNIITVSRGIAINGSGVNVAQGLSVANNTIGNPVAGAADQVWGIGITVQGSTNAVVSGNTVYVEGWTSSSTTNKAIDFGTVSTAGSGAIIEKNIVAREYNNSTGGWAAYGINIAGGNNHIIRNNFVYNVNAFMNNGGLSTTFAFYGIRIAAGTGHQIYHNSVNMYGPVLGSSSFTSCAALCIISTASTGMDIRNNIFANTITGAPASSSVTSILLPSGATGAMNLTINNNAYYQGSGTGAAIGQIGTSSGTGIYLASNFNASAITPATNLRSYTSTLNAGGTNDNASQAFVGAPPFTSTTNLHIPAGTPSTLESRGATIGVANDIDGDVRPGPAGSVNGGATAPDLGADEFDGLNCSLVPALSVTPSAPSICPGSTISLTASAGFVSYAWTPSSGINPTNAATVNASPTTTTSYTVTGTIANGCTATTSVSVAVLASPSFSSITATPSSVCLNGSTQLNASAPIIGPPTSTYTRTTLSGQTYTQLSGSGITVINSAAQLTPTMGSGNQDDGGVLITLPFTFTYMGAPFTQMSMCTNGWVGAGNQSTIDATNMRTTGNLFTTAIPNNTIAAWFRDMGANFPTGGGSMRHGLIGTDIYAFQWDNAVGSGFSDGSTIVISFQINIYGPNSTTPGRIEIIYGPTTGAITTGTSIGIEDAIGGTNHYINALDGSGTTTTTSSVWPGNGFGYRFDPVVVSYVWAPITSLSATNIPNPVASSLTTSTGYTVTATTGNGCTTTRVVNVLVDQTATPVVAPSTTTLCNGQIQQLTASSRNSGAVSTTSSGAVAVSIPDNNPAGVTNAIAVSGIPAGAVITNIAVNFSISHPADGDLVLNLKAPNGNVLNLVNQKGGSGANFVSTYIASYPGLPAVPAAGAPFTNMYAPDGVLSVGPTGLVSNVINFAGLFATPNGTWTLAASDAIAGNTGLITNWTVTIYYLTADNITWTPATGLYTNSGATVAYVAGTNLPTVYAKPAATTTYTITATSTGSCTTSANATVNVNQLPAIASAGQPVNQNLCPGNTATFTVTATGTGLTYQWYHGATALTNGGNISGATSSTLTITNIASADSGSYSVTVSGVCSPSVTSNTVILAVGAPPIIGTQPLTQIACAGNTIRFTVASAGTNTYQWRKGGVNLTNGGNVSGATSATLTISPVAANDAGNYDVIVTNSCSQSSTSAVAVLTFSTADRWLGTSNSDWNNPNNWCNGVPTSTTDVVIPAGTTYPALVTATNDVRNLQVDAGATLTVTSSGWLNIYGSTLTVNGTFNPAAGTLSFRNTANLNVPGMTVSNIVMNGTGGITTSGNLNVTTALTLINGNITIGNNNLVVPGGTSGSAASHIVTTGTGVVSSAVNAATVIFPVGPTAASYNPVWIANGQGLNYTVRVATGVPATLANSARAINRTWTVNASATPANAASLTFGYADVDANASATPTANMEIGYYNGTAWVLTTPAGGAAPTGTATNRLVATTSKTFGTMVVSNTGGVLFPTGTPNLDADIYSVKLMPNVIDQQGVLRVMSRRAMNVEWTVTDIQGRVVMKFSHGVLAGQNDMNLKLGHLAIGSYQIVGYTDKGLTNVIKFIRM
jgi:subtilisin-like proprotein convertase family protein